MRFKEDERRVLFQQLANLGFTVCFTPVTNRLHRHIFFFHFATVDQHLTNAAIGMTVFPCIAEKVKRTAITKVDIPTTLHIHNEVIHQRVAVSEDVFIAQCPRVDLRTRRQTTTFWRHTVNRILKLALAGMARLNYRRVIACKLHVTIVVGTFHLPGINAELAHIAGITACAQPLLHRVINITLVAIQTR